MISFDGNVFTGKTHIAQCLAYSHCWQYIGEHVDYLFNARRKAPQKEFTWNKHAEYCATEKDRTAQAAAPTVVLDRSFLSLSAHVYCLFKTQKTDLRMQYVDFLKTSLAKKQLLVPNSIVHLHCSRSQGLVRWQQGKQKKTPELFLQQRYWDANNTFYTMLQCTLPLIAVSSSTSFRKTQEKVEQLLQNSAHYFNYSSKKWLLLHYQLLHC